MRRTLFIAAAVPLLVLVGGGGAVASAAPTAATPAPMTDPDPSDDPAERARQFTQCMRDNGIDLPDPTESDGPVHVEIGPDEKEAFDSAHEACDEFAPPHGGTVELDPAMREQVEEFHRCLEDHGVDLPEPGGLVVAITHEAEAGAAVRHEHGEAAPGTPPPPDAGPRVVTPLPGSEEAVEACRDLLPVPPGGHHGPVVVGTAGDVTVAEAGHTHAGGVGIAVSVAKDGE